MWNSSGKLAKFNSKIYQTTENTMSFYAFHCSKRHDGIPNTMSMNVITSATEGEGGYVFTPVCLL